MLCCFIFNIEGDKISIIAFVSAVSKFLAENVYEMQDILLDTRIYLLYAVGNYKYPFPIIGKNPG